MTDAPHPTRPRRAAASLRSRLRNRELVFGAWTSFGHPGPTEIFARIGVDFVGIDIEHSTISQEQSQRIIAASQASGAHCLPRIASHNMEMIKRLLDSGADGVIVPMVSNIQEVANLVRWVKYAPVGARSFGIARAQGYGFDFAEYAGTWNERSTIVVQIESVEGVHNIDAILGIEDVDAVMIGPYDLSGSLGVPGQLAHPKVLEAMATVIHAAKRAGKGCGTQFPDPTPDSVRRAIDEGYTFVVLGSDVFVLWKWAERMRGLIQETTTSARG